MSTLPDPNAERPQLRIFDPAPSDRVEGDETPLTKAVRQIEEEVMEEFAERWNRAGWLGRLILNYRMKLIIEERFEKLRPRLGWPMRQHFREESNGLQMHVVNVRPHSDDSLRC